MRIEQGNQHPGIDIVERMAAGLGVSPCWLAFGDEGPEPFQQKRPRSSLPLDLPSPEPGPLEIEDLHQRTGARLRLRREELALSLRQLADSAGVSYQTIAYIEAGSTVPKVDSVHRLAVALDVAPCWLAYGVGRKPG